MAIDLGDVYLSDATFASGDVFYYNLTTGDVASTGGGGFADFTARFPEGSSIPAGASRTTALSGSSAFANAYAVAPDHELFEVERAYKDQPPSFSSSESYTTSGTYPVTIRVLERFSGCGVGVEVAAKMKKEPAWK